MTSTVFIWNNNLVTNGHDYGGHAAINIGNTLAWKTTDNCTESFVGWTGAYDESGNRKKQGKAILNIFHDISMMEYAPDHIIEIPTTFDNESKMRSHWQEILGKKVIVGKGEEQIERGPRYDWIWKNCSTIAQRVLKSGKIDWSLNPVQWNLARKHVIWTPLDVRDLALSYRGAKKIAWFDWVNSQALTGDERTILHHLQRRHERHGSSGAPARRWAEYYNVRLLHTRGYTFTSDYHNTLLLRVIREIGNRSALFKFNWKDSDGRLRQECCTTASVAQMLRDRRWECFQRNI